MKKIISVFLTVILCISSFSITFAESEEVYILAEEIDFNSSPIPVNYSITNNSSDYADMTVMLCWYDASGNYRGHIQNNLYLDFGYTENLSETIVNEDMDITSVKIFAYGKNSSYNYVISNTIEQGSSDSIIHTENDGDYPENGISVYYNIEEQFLKFHVNLHSTFGSIIVRLENHSTAYLNLLNINSSSDNFSGTIDMSNFPAGHYSLMFDAADGGSQSASFNHYTKSDIEFFLDEIQSGNISYENFYTKLENYGFLTEEFLSEIYSLSESKSKFLAYENLLYRGCSSIEELKNALFEQLFVSSLQYWDAGTIIYLLDKYYTEIGLTPVYFSITDKTALANSLQYKEITSFSELNNYINEYYSNITIQPPSGTVGGSGGGLSYSFVKSLTYTCTNESAIITGFTKETELEDIFSITIPKEIEGKPVTKISSKAFSTFPNIVHFIAIPETVTEIAANAFEGLEINGQIYIYGTDSSLLEPFSSLETDNIAFYLPENSDIYKTALDRSFKASPINTLGISLTENEGNLKCNLTDNSETFHSFAELYIIDTNGVITYYPLNEGEQSIELGSSSSIYINIEDRIFEISSLPYCYSGYASNPFEYNFNISDVKYDAVENVISLSVFKHSDCAPDAKKKCLLDITYGEYIKSEVVEITFSEPYKYPITEDMEGTTCTFIADHFYSNFYIYSAREKAEKISALQSGIKDTASFNLTVDELGFLSKDNNWELYNYLTEDAILTLCEYMKSSPSDIGMAYEYFKEKMLLLSLNSEYSTITAETAKDLLANHIAADYHLLSEDEKFSLLNAILSLSFDSVSELSEYIKNYILSCQEFTVTFLNYDGTVLSEQKVMGLSSAIPPQIANTVEIDGRTHVFKGWDMPFDKISGNLEIKAIYFPQYSIIFMAGTQIIKVASYTSPDEITEPQVPEKTGYNGIWEEYTPGNMDLFVNAIYTPIEYTLNFIADGILIKKIPFTIVSTDITIPDVPAKSGYDGYWENFTIDETFIENEDFNIEAYYIGTSSELISANGIKPSGNTISLPDTKETTLELDLEVSDKAVYTISVNTDSSGNIILTEGMNTFSVKVIAENGSFSEYKVNVYKYSDQRELLSIENGKISGNDVLLNSVSYSTETLSIAPEVSPLASWELYKDKNLVERIDELTLDYGLNTAWLKVISESGLINVYEISVVRREQLSAVQSSMISGYYLPGISSFELSHSKENATIYYTTDGSIPTDSSLKYSTPILFTEDITITAIAVYEGYDPSAPQTFIYKKASEIQSIKIEQIFGTNAVASFEQIEGAKEINVYEKTTEGEIKPVNATVNSDNSSVLVSGLTENTYVCLIITAVFENGDTSRTTEWFLTEDMITSDCEVIGMNDPNAIIDNRNLTITGLTVANSVTSSAIKAYVSKGASYAVYPSKNSSTSYPENTVNLKEGKNIFYIKVTASNSITQKVYKVTIHRNTKATAPEIKISDGKAVITAEEGCSIIYTTDGSIPNLLTGIRYSVPFDVCDGMIIRAITSDASKDEISDETITEVSIKVSECLIDIIDIYETDEYIEYYINIVTEEAALPKSTIMLFAEYDSQNNFKTVYIKPLNLLESDTVIFEKLQKSGADTYFKIMLWESLQSIKPVAKFN